MSTNINQGHTSPPRANENGHCDVERKQQPVSKDRLIRSRRRALVQDFSPIWFTWCMNIGIISILLHQHPYQFKGIRTLSIIAACLDVLLFIVFSTIFLVRLAVYRVRAFREITSDISQLALLGCWVIAYLTLPSIVSLLVSQAYWGGYWAMMLAYVMWWIGAFWTLATLCFIFMIIARRHLAGEKSGSRIESLPTLIIIPAVSVVTCALIGAEVVSSSHYMNPRLAVPVIIASFPLLGIGMTLAVFLYAILFRQLLETGFPAPAQVTSMFVYVGPFGQSAGALQALGMAARAYFGPYNHGTFLTDETSMALDAACVLGALILIGPGVLFVLFSIYAVFDVAITTKKVRWTPSWNAIIFPTATVTTATTSLSVSLDSSTFRVLTSIQLILLVMVLFVNMAFTLLGIYKGELLIVRQDPRLKKQMEEEQKER